ncbi:MAG: hypothetical protein AB7H93_24190 [Vicinamibacterales bacterium]
MAINATWHRSHKMPTRPTAAQRLTWHEQHARHCDCRPFTVAMRRKLEQAVADATARPKATARRSRG